MHFDISEDAVKKIVEANLTQAVERAVQSYSVESAIKEQVASALIAKAVYDACDGIDKEALAIAVAQSVSSAVIRATTLIVAESLASTVLTLRGVQTYDKDRAAKHQAATRELLGLPAEAELPVNESMGDSF